MFLLQKKLSFLCSKYSSFNKDEKSQFLSGLASQYAVNHERICELAKRLSCKEVIKKNMETQVNLKHSEHI